MGSLGPNIVSVGAPDNLVWVQRSWNYLHRWHRLGPASSRRVPPILQCGLSPLTIIPADGIALAQHCLWRVSPMPLFGPSMLKIKPTDGIAWAQQHYGGHPGYGPSTFKIIFIYGVASGERCLWRVPPMLSYGPSTLTIVSTDGIAWVQHHLGGCPRCLSAALVWAQRIQNYFRRWRRLGPTSSRSVPRQRP
jgi:hypothetical protein